MYHTQCALGAYSTGDGFRVPCLSDCGSPGGPVLCYSSRRYSWTSNPETALLVLLMDWHPYSLYQIPLWFSKSNFLTANSSWLVQFIFSSLLSTSKSRCFEVRCIIISYATLEKFMSLSKLQFPHLTKWEVIPKCIVDIEIKWDNKCLVSGTQMQKLSINVSTLLQCLNLNSQFPVW